MAAKDLGPLDWRTPIVDSSGRPSPEFQRRWNTQRVNNGLIGTTTLGSGPPVGTPSDGAEFVDVSTTPFTVYIGSGGSWHKAGVVVFTDLADAPHSYAGKSLALVRVKSTVDGVEFATQSSMLDSLGAPASGQLLQRGASTWGLTTQSAVLDTLGAPASGQLLQRGLFSWGLVTLSTVLDTISNTRGSVLYRGAGGWVALPPSTAGFVLQTGGAGADPSWVAQSGGGGGGGGVPQVMWSQCTATGTNGFGAASLGNVAKVRHAFSITGILADVTIAAVGEVYQAGIYELTTPTGTVIAAVTGVTPTVTTTAAGRQILEFTLAAAVALVAGKSYAFFLTRTNSTTTVIIPTFGVNSATDFAFMGAPLDPGGTNTATRFEICALASVSPAVGNTITKFSGSESLGLKSY